MMVPHFKKGGTLAQAALRVEAQLRAFEQDRRNARVIGEVVVRQLVQRIVRKPDIGSSSAAVNSLLDNAHSRSVDLDAREIERTTRSQVDRWTLMGAAELVASLGGMDRDELELVLKAERDGRNRPVVIGAIEDRLADGDA